MAPILIDNRGLIKLGLISLLTVFVVFSAGYFIGYQKATVFYSTASEIENLELPERNLVDASNIAPQSPESVTAGEDIDVDQPVVTRTADAQDQSNHVAVIKPAKTTITSLKNSANIDLPSEESIEVEQQASSKSIQSSNSSMGDNSNKTKKIDVSSLTNNELNKIKYSVQVGVYGNLINAENKAKMLQSQQFDAYVADYKNKKNEVRYNVRFGYYTNKKAAILGLKKYKDAEKGDGYLVNFSIENIVNLADKNTINDNVKPESSIDVINESKPSEIDSSEVTYNRILQEKYLSKLQSEAVIKN